MDCSGIVCKHCQGEIVCINCEAQDTTVCKNCSAEVRVPVRLKRETYDPRLVAELLLAVSRLEWRRELSQVVDAAVAVQGSKNQR